MIKPIMKDVLFLGQKSEPATKADAYIITDLTDTLRANLDNCVGMAANMIGIKKCIIVFTVGDIIVPMVNPVIKKKMNSYEAEECCLSLTGFRKTTRYKTIEVEYLDKNFKKQKGTFTGYTAQIIQHEIDHCNGIII
ncbi:peptide deformylase [Clostridium sp. SM-530-WT-3G]|uniref:peptide deformylase n=1 Tax=Clostridium sp. SM-530-WT-3G TaxID=2725303 RepID=UPI00145E6358|nr:peptide deformylase [Clostridium sp. SM-530-WT-3G]NME83448.1 peptide deformylase [Clostridium sp. SM-530-WT-3G]